MMGLIVSGPGFVVLLELRKWAASQWRRTGRIERLSLHAKIVLATTALAILSGMLLILTLEAGNTWPLAHGGSAC